MFFSYATIFPLSMITVVFTKILLLKTYQMRSLLIDWLLGNNYLRKRFCYFIFIYNKGDLHGGV